VRDLGQDPASPVRAGSVVGCTWGHLVETSCWGFCVRFWARSQNCENRLFVASVSPSAWNCSLTGKMLMKFGIWVFFFEGLLRKFKFH
jgi:hypothetical protein